MDTIKTRYGFSLLLLTLFICVDASSNDTSKEEPLGELREPRVSGRIVKVYSGTRLEPVLCINEGFQSDPVNCAVFYRCVKERNGRFSVFRYQCAPGTVYDPDLETCNFPRNTKRSECGGIKKPISNPVQPEYINEVEGVGQEVPHPISTLAPIFTEKTTRQSTLSSQKYEKPITSTIIYDANTHNNVISVFTTKNPWTSTTVHKNEKYWTENPKTTSSNVTPSGTNKRDICFQDGFTGDFDNCRKFYRCVGNQKGGFMRYEFYCSESTVWDDDLQSCNHPWAVKRSKCGRSLQPNQYETDAELVTMASGMNQSEYGYKTDKTIQKQLQISHGSKVSQIQTQISHSDNVIQNQTQINYGDRTNNTKQSEANQNQTQISYGSAVSQTQTQIDYGNKGMQTQLQIDHSKNSSQSQTQIHESTTKQTTTSQHTQQGTNSNQCSENGFMGDSSNCKKFYRCVDNGRGSFTKYEYLCGEGTVWDSNIESCNHAWAVKECGGHETEPNKEEIKTTTTTTTTTKSTSVGTTKTTHGYQTITTESPDDDIDVGYGNQGSSGDTTSSTFTTSTTEKTNSEGSECTSSGFMGDVNNCKIFYRCVDNGRGFTKHEFKCGEGTLWDPDIEACNHAWAVKKCGGSSSSHKEETTTIKQTTLGVQTTVTLVQTTTQPSTVSDDDDLGYGQPAEETLSSSKPTTTSHNQKDECVSSGFMGDSKDCKKFYRCVDNGNGGFTKHEFTCGEGTVWDPKIASCNHAWAVESCGGNNNNGHETQNTNEPTPASQTTITDTNTNSPPPESTSTSSFTTISTTESAMGTDCTNSGFMGDDKDCKKFYRCVDNGDGTYTRYEFTCGEGTVWDARIEACNHAWDVEKCGGSKEPSGGSEATTSQSPILHEEEEYMTTQSPEISGTMSSATTTTQNEITSGSNDCNMSGYFGDKNDCKKFYRCIDDGNDGYYRYEFTCGEGTVWDDSIRACNHAWAVKECGPSNTQQSSTQSSTDSPEEGNQEPIEETTSEVSSNTHATQKPQTTQGICESEGFYGDFSDCKKFYRCVDNGKGGYTKYDFACGDGTTWNPEINACDHESDDKSCLSTSTSSGSTSTSAPQFTETSTSTTTEKQTQDSSNTDSGTTDQCTSEGFFAHSQDCKKFIRCVGSGNGQYTKYEFSCGEGTVWVQEITACDHDYGHCESQSSTSSRPQNSENPNTTSSNEEHQTPSKENDEYEAPNESPQNDESDDECTSEGYYGNSKDCTKFYRCVDNGNGGYTKYDFSCGEGTAWDSNIQTCNHKSEVESCTRNSNDETQTQQTLKDEQSQTPESSSSTTKQTSSTTEAASSSKDTCEEEGYFGDSQDCKKFYRCVDNGKGGFTKYDFMCGEGTIWDQDITNCNHPQDVSNPSCNSQQGESTSSSSSETTTSSPQSSSSTTESQSSSNCSQDNSSGKPGGNKNVTCDKAGYYPDSNDCKKFYRCVDWDGDGKRFSVYHFECGEGTIWDPALDTCNHEESVYPPRDCSGSQSQSQSESTTEQSTTSQQTTTEESTTTEQTTTTTEQSTTSDQTTTQQQTTSEQTTTQQQTTSEQTTTQQQTTSEQTTTQQQTTSEQTTTQKSTTSEQTTQQQTTSEQTTQQQTTSEKTTTQQSTTEQTTQESTTSEQTTEQTTQESTTSQQSTTQESTTSEQTTEGGETTESTTEQTESTTDQSTTDSTTTEEQESTTEASSSSDCPETEDDQYVFVCPTSFKRHPKYCNMFYQCTEDEDTHDANIAMFKCPNETIYDESQTQCVEEKKADKKCEGEMARKQRFKRLSNKEAIVVDQEKKSCPNVGYYAFEKSECSPAFLKCEKHKSGKLKGFVNQCPKGYIFWSISKRCERTATIRDCKISTNDWTERWNIPIDRKNIAF